MKRTNLFNFTVDKENKKVIVEKSFQAGINLVWSAWTEPDILDLWWAPKPWKSKTKSMNFEVGGRRLYAMVGPEGEEHWALADFTSISPKTNFKYKDAFCDTEGNINEDFPRSEWNVDFIESDSDTTTVLVEIYHQNLSDLEKIIEMGFKEGFTIALNGLDEILPTFSK